MSMSVVPLYGRPTPAACDARRGLSAPGGYQGWTFEAEDRSGTWQLSASFFEGFPLHPQYLRKYEAYRRAPTRLAPPMPREFPCVVVSLYGNGATVAQFLCAPRPEDCRFASDRLDVRIGASHFCRQGDGSIHLGLRGTPWGMTLLGPRPIEAQQVTANLVFRPEFAHSCLEQTLAERKPGGESPGYEHRWMLADAYCHVQGTIRFYGRGGMIDSQAVPFTGRGSHEHTFGTAPLAGAIRRYVRARLMLKGRTTFVHLIKPADIGVPERVQLVAADSSRFEVVQASGEAHDWRCRTGYQIRYPSKIDMGPRLRLSHPRLVASTPISARVEYRAFSLGVDGFATCDVIFPHRASRPGLRHVLGSAIQDH
jgi:hypothetical protein